MGELTSRRARELLRYDPETGRLFWRVSRHKARAGVEAGCVSGLPGLRYRLVGIDGRRYLAHRLAWLIVTGAWPIDQLDHIDGDGLNNRWRNLRAATNKVNGRNAKRSSRNTSGVTGVHWNKGERKWEAQISVNGTNIYLGLFDTLATAVAARKAAERRYGFNANHGRAA